MKKLLTVLGSMTLMATVSASVIACKTTDSTVSETQLAQKVKNIWNDNFKDKITSAKNYSMIIEMIKDKLNEKEKQLVHLYNKDESKKRPVKEQENQKINIRIGEKNIKLDFGEVKEGKKLTTYRDPKTKEIKTTNAKDFSAKENPELNNVTEIIEIGYYEHKDIQDGNKLYIRAVAMPTSIQIVPKELPREITSTRSMFWDAKDFNQDISMWDTSNLESLDAMFLGAKKFNQDLSKWDVSNVKILDRTFFETKEFNQDLSKWDVSNVESMKKTFAQAQKYNNADKPLTWNEKTKNVKTMYTMFAKNPVFNQDISKWNVSNVEDMTQMFLEAKEFNQDLSNWDVGNVKKMRFMFGSAEKFNNKGKSLNSWNVSKVDDMGNMFNKAKIFNQDISNWKTSSLTNIEAMFLGAEKFDQDLSKWDTSKIKVYSSYNKDASSWKDKQSKYPKIPNNK
ncbi:BspA family leucine-rich repeat surface protein [Mycoplasma capricolum]|uniref:BspA family leucine-rich repeat surface protein n=1 Tax=Mycoplasma capricolum TaxID=2095 RepID=UPI00062A31C3|nr:BspA family leucine-rich repeat surface protein [Mycoplasma capricolum]KKW61241.1 Prolipoprotein Q [Mycoplasma capricolum subsp. capricolum]